MAHSRQVAVALGFALAAAACGSGGGHKPVAPGAVSAEVLTTALVTTDDVPAFRRVHVAPQPTAPLTFAQVDSPCGKLSGYWDSLSLTGSEPRAVESLAGDPTVSPIIFLRAFPSADAAAARVSQLEESIAGCADTVTAALLDPGLGDSFAGYASDRMTFVVARVGSATVAVQVIRDPSSDTDVQTLTKRAEDIATKQVAKLRVVLKG